MDTHESIARALLSASLDNFMDSDGIIKCCVEATVAQKAAEMLKAQEPRVLQIKEMAFLEIAVFIETNGDLKGKDTDLFLAIPYIYAVSQNMLDGYIAFVDGNTDVYDLQAIDYGKSWRCWTSRPTDEQRAATPWPEEG
jgi:hypothetical protein